MDKYSQEILNNNEDDGTIVRNVEELEANVIGHKIVSAQKINTKDWFGRETQMFEITLDSGKRVALRDSGDCCAYTQLEGFLLNVENIDHVITGIGTTGEFTTWHIYADIGDVLALKVGWSCGNPFYYGYGFDIAVTEPVVESAEK